MFLLAALLATSAHAGVVFTSLYSFTGTNDGAYPEATLVQGSDGYLYGTTVSGGTNGYISGPVKGHGGGNFISTPYGTVFKISTNGTLTTLYYFGSITNVNHFPLDGAYPQAGLIQGSDGNFYGTTEGDGDYTYDYGTVFEISTNGALTNLCSFNGYDGAIPLASLVQGSDGNFYGTTRLGGAGFDDNGEYNTAFGTVYKISTNGVLTSLHTFDYTGYGIEPRAGLVQGNDGNFYGTTSGGGIVSAGAVFKISTDGTRFTNLYSLSAFGADYSSDVYTNSDGISPAGLVQDSDGNFYGTTGQGGTNGSGTVFKINPDGTGFTTLHTFAAANVDVNNANYAPQ